MSKQTKTTPPYIYATLSQDKTRWINTRPFDGFYYLQFNGDRVLMFTKFICAN